MCVVVADPIDGSDSDSNLDEDEESLDYYQPISTVDECEDGDLGRISADDLDSLRLPNGFMSPGEAENGIASLSLGDDAESSNRDEEKDEADEGIAEDSDSVVTRAFREDDDRRNAPLTEDNAVRVMEAMRGVSFTGVAPDWAHRVPESDWIDQVRRLSESTRRP